jgi:glucose/arabinose dehydrogenase
VGSTTLSRARWLGLWLGGLLALMAASSCGGEAATRPTATPAGTAGELSIPPLPLGTPGSRDPSHLGPADATYRLIQSTVIENDALIADPTTLAFGPDGRLYVGQLDGRITALTLTNGGAAAVEEIMPAGQLGNLLGIAFNAGDPLSPVTLYVSHTRLYEGIDGPAFAGTISKLVAPDFAPEAIITGLPVSAEEHGTNGIAFDGAGRLFIAQGAGTNAGVPSERHARDESPLSAAILVADVSDHDFNGELMYETAEDGAVDLVSGDVRVYASGLRNPYDLVVHSNGRIYATDNGANAADGDASTGCASSGAGPNGPDELDLIIEGRYYGHPNRNRGRTDERQCTYRRVDDDSGESTPPIATLAYYVSADGMAEYTSDALGADGRGDLIYVEWAKGHVWRVDLADDGTSVETISPLLEEPLQRPIDVAIGPDGTIYMAEMGADRILAFGPVRNEGL